LLFSLRKHSSIWTLITKIKNKFLTADRAKLPLQNIGDEYKTKCLKLKTDQKTLKPNVNDYTNISTSKKKNIYFNLRKRL